MKKPFVFISYSTKEAEIANLVHSYLDGNGINCWIASQNIEGGESFAVQIVEAIANSYAVIMIASSSSNDSNHVSNELSLAFHHKKKIIPFRIEDFELSAANTYFLIQAQWINAFENMNEALKHLLYAVRLAYPSDAPEVAPAPSVPVIKNPIAAPKKEDEMPTEDDTPSLSRDEIVNLLLSKIDKFPYCLRDRTFGEQYDIFKAKAKILFEHTLSMYFKGRPTAKGIDFVDIIVDTLSQGQGISIQVKGLPGCAKNMLIQLAYYKMLENFRTGESDYLPLYLSSSYYEKRPYSKEKAREEMTELICEESKEFFTFIKKNPSTRPVLMLEAVREHIVSSFAPEDVILDLWQRFGKFNRIVAVDVGLIKNKLRHKRTIPLIGDVSGYTFKFNSVPITEKQTCLTVISTVLDMYIEKYEGLEAIDVYNSLCKLRFSTIDIFTIRLVATELSQGHSSEDISLTDMYERLALNELHGDEDKVLAISKELYNYVFNSRHNVKTKQYNAVLWSLPHKHNTYLEFMVAYYFCHCIETYEKDGNLEFMRRTMTSMENHFMATHLSENYPLQDRFLNLILKNYDSFDVFQKSNAAYWLGKLTFADLTEKAVDLLEKEYDRLRPIVKNNNRTTLSNRYDQYLFRSICLGLIFHGRSDILDEYLCLIVINDVANSINRGAVIQYLGDSSNESTPNDFYTDNNPNVGEQALRILCSRVETKLNAKRAGYVETDLVSLLTLIQARMHIAPEKLHYTLTPYAEKCLRLLSEYQDRPRSIVSDKLMYYFQSVSDDIECYIDNSRFDAGFSLYTDLSKMKEVKRSQWLDMGINDPESLAEHTMNSWTLAMIFLPDECDDQGYSKREVLDMLLVHDMAEAVLGDLPSQLSEPTKELKTQNALIRKLFLKGTYPEVSNMTHYYNVWVGYYNGQNINARIARDINLIQTVNTFFDYFLRSPKAFEYDKIKEWLQKCNKLSTNIGYELFDRIIVRNPIYRKAVDKLLTK